MLLLAFIKRKAQEHKGEKLIQWIHSVIWKRNMFLDVLSDYRQTFVSNFKYIIQIQNQLLVLCRIDSILVWSFFHADKSVCELQESVVIRKNGYVKPICVCVKGDCAVFVTINCKTTWNNRTEPLSMDCLDWLDSLSRLQNRISVLR